MSQEPNQHSQEEHHVSHENGESVDEPVVSFRDDTGIYQGIKCRFNLLKLCAHEYIVSVMGTPVMNFAPLSSLYKHRYGK